MPVTLNISSLNIKLVASSGHVIEKWGTAPLPAGLIKDGNIVDVQAVAAKIDSLFKSLGVPRTQVIITLAGISFTYRLLTLPSIKPALLKEAVERAAQKEIPLPLDSLYIDWQIIKDNGKELQVFVAGVPRNLVDTVLRTASLARISAAALDIKPLAVARAASQSNAIVIDFEPDGFNIVIVAESVPVILHTIMPKSEAAGIEDNVSQILDELNRTVNFYNLTHAESPIPSGAPLIICGENAGDDAVIQMLQSQSEYTVQPLTVPFQYPSGFSPAVYAGNAGLILKNVSGNRSVRMTKNSKIDVNLNFLTARRKSLTKPVSISDLLVPPLVVMGIALIIFLFVIRSQAATQTTSLQSDLDALNRNITVSRAAADKSAAIEKKIMELTGKMQNLEKENVTLNGKGGLTGTLAFFAGNLPSGASLTAINVTLQEIVLDGRMKQRADVFAYAGILEKQGGNRGVRIAAIDTLTNATGENGLEGYNFQFVITR